MAWNMELLVCGVTLALWLIFYRRMVPLVECSDTEMTTTTNMNGGGGSGSLRQHLTRSTSKVFDINGVKQPANAIVAEANAVAANTRALVCLFLPIIQSTETEMIKWVFRRVIFDQFLGLIYLKKNSLRKKRVIMLWWGCWTITSELGHFRW